MPSEQRPDAGQRLLGMLSAGAGPFPYRGGVYRLLGIAPRAGARMAAPPPLPPVALQYQSNAWPQPSSSPFGMAPAAPPRQPATLGTARPARGESGEGRGTLASLAPAERGMAGGPTARPEATRSIELPGHTHGSRGRGPSGTPSPAEARLPFWTGVMPSAAPARREDIAAQVRSAPGGAERRTAGAGDAAERKASAAQVGGSPEDAPAPVDPVGLAIPGTTRRSAAAPSPAKPSPAKPSPAKPSPAKPGAGVQGATAIPGARPQEQRTAEAVSSVPSPAPGTERSGAPRVRSASPSTTPAGTDGGLLRALAPSRPRDAAETPQLRSNARALEQVEALRGTAARRADRPAPATAEPARTEPPREAPRPAETPAPEAPRILVVRPGPEPVRTTSRSFWSASTLRGVHFRVLR